MASDTELRNLVDEFLYLVEVGSGSQLADESELEHLLDRLALAMRTLVVPGEPEEFPAVPARNFDVLQKVARSRFPQFGTYACPGPLAAGSAVSAPAPARAADAIADVAAIADELHAVAWLWRSAGFDAGAWALEQSFRARWGRRMRALQLYLHDRRSAEEQPEEQQ